MGFPVGHIDLVQEEEKQQAEASKVIVQPFIVELIRYCHDRKYKNGRYQEDHLFSSSKPQDNRQGFAPMLPVTMPIFYVFDNFPDKINEKREDGVRQNQQLIGLVIKPDDVYRQTGEESHGQVAYKGKPLERIAVKPQQESGNENDKTHF